MWIELILTAGFLFMPFFILIALFKRNSKQVKNFLVVFVLSVLGIYFTNPPYESESFNLSRTFIEEHLLTLFDEESSEGVALAPKVQIINNNIPNFSNVDLEIAEPFVEYGPMDSLYRVTAANALLDVSLMPTKERESIASVTPTGFEQTNYEFIGAGGWLYNRSHLIGFQLAGGNANPKNLMTGTRWLNESMLEYENFIATYIENDEGQVRYRVTPHFKNSDLVASGIYMEAFSIDDFGKSVQFHIYIPNVQDGVRIDYQTGHNQAS